MKGKLFILLGISTLTFSCVPLSREVMRQVDENLTYQLVQQDPERYRGKTVLWGGVIIETTNRKDETLIKVSATELDMEKRPKNLDRSAGRFIVRYGGFLDPVIYKQGREITVGGEIIGQEILPLGETQYSYPVLSAKEIHLWERRVYYRYPDPYYWDPFWYPYWYPYRYPYWRYRPWYW